MSTMGKAMPKGIAAGMMAGILFQFGTQAFRASMELPTVVFAMLAAYLLGKRWGLTPKYVPLDDSELLFRVETGDGFVLGGGKAADAESALALPLGDGKVADAIAVLEAKIGEKLELSNVARFPGAVHNYLHRRSQDLPPQVGVLVEYEGTDEEFDHAVALQIASMRPDYVSREDVPAEVVAREERIATETAKEEGKPDKIIPKIVEGRVNAFYKEACLLEQQSISEDKKTVGQLAQASGVTRSACTMRSPNRGAASCSAQCSFLAN